MSLDAFLKQNIIPTENVKYVASKRIQEDGKPVEWELRAVSATEDEEIRKACTKRVPVQGKRGIYNTEMDGRKYLHMLAAESVVFPPLKNAELQDSYGVKEPYRLLEEMLNAGELGLLLVRVQEVCGFNSDEDDKVEEVKN